MKKAVMVAILLSIFFLPSLTIAQSTPPDVPTLGPVVYFYYSPNNETVISSPSNGGEYQNPIFLNFSVTATTMLGQFGNIGYSLDGGIIKSVSSFINKSVDYHPTDAPAWYYYNTTVLASLVLPSLSEGVHNVTVYYGWQYLGTPENPSLQRFEVQSLATSNFTVGITVSSPTPTVPEFPSWTIPLLLTIMVALAGLLVYHKKHKRRTENE